MYALLLAAVLTAGDIPPSTAPVAPAQEGPMAFSLGQVLEHNLSVCLDKADAVEIVNAAKVSHEAAMAKWGAKDRCQSVPVVGGPTVGRIVHSASIQRDGKPLTLKVVEIEYQGKVIGYFMTVLPVSAKLVVTEPPRKFDIKPDGSLKNS